MKLEKILNEEEAMIKAQVKSLFGFRYDLKLINGKGHVNHNSVIHSDNSYVEFDIYLDTQLGFILERDEKPNAIFGFEEEKDLIIFKQIQGITGYDFWNKKNVYPKGLFNQKWREKVYAIVKNTINNKLKLGIVSSKNLEYANVNIKNYDVFALNMGLKLDKNKGIYL